MKFTPEQFEKLAKVYELSNENDPNDDDAMIAYALRFAAASKPDGEWVRFGDVDFDDFVLVSKVKT